MVGGEGARRGGQGRTCPGQVDSLGIPTPHIWAVQSQQLTAATGPLSPRGSRCSHQAKCLGNLRATDGDGGWHRWVRVQTARK